jgi:hypothetical protein
MTIEMTIHSSSQIHIIVKLITIITKTWVNFAAARDAPNWQFGEEFVPDMAGG